MKNLITLFFVIFMIVYLAKLIARVNGAVAKIALAEPNELSIHKGGLQ